MIRHCPRCGKLPTIHKGTFGKHEYTAVYCEENPCVGSKHWFTTEERAIDEWNIGAIARSFIDGDITWEQANAEMLKCCKKEEETCD